jgi:hypothetical protein
MAQQSCFAKGIARRMVPDFERSDLKRWVV